MIRAMRLPGLAASLVAVSLPVVVIATLGAATGCKSSHDKAQERAAATEVPGQLQLTDGGLTLTSESGVIALGETSKVPDDFPKNVPVYPGAKVDMAAHRTGAKGKPAWSLSLETGDEQAKVVAFYTSGMTASAGKFTKASDLAMGDTQMTVWQSADYDVTLMISAGAENQTTILLTVAGK
jgi:hypothetical protein